MTSLFSRLQKLNKEATPPEWWLAELPDRPDSDARVVLCGDPAAEWDPLFTTVKRDAALIVECRNSLPAVLNAIDLLRRLSEWDALAPPVQAPFGDGPLWKREIDAALEPFIKEQP